MNQAETNDSGSANPDLRAAESDRVLVIISTEGAEELGANGVMTYFLSMIRVSILPLNSP